MKLSTLVGVAVGYVLGSRAGRDRYEQIVALGRRIAGSQTVQSTAGVLQAQFDSVTAKARESLTSKLPTPSHSANGTNGYHR